LLIGMAGWYYLFYSRAAHRLSFIESEKPNVRRVRLRRTNGVAMVALAVLLYVGTHVHSLEQRLAAFATIWIAVMLLLAVIVLLALIDVRMTLQLRQRRRRDDDREPK
jgi:hypothetical protein